MQGEISLFSSLGKHGLNTLYWSVGLMNKSKLYAYDLLSTQDRTAIIGFDKVTMFEKTKLIEFGLSLAY